MDYEEGTINLNIADTLTVSGYSLCVIFYPTDLVIKNQPTAIASSTFGTGQAGHILISARQILLLDKGCITVSTVSTGNA